MRIVGLPGERLAIADGRISVDGRPIAEPYVTEGQRSHEAFGPVVLGANEYFVMGDNRRNSSDSREWGPVSRQLIGRRLYSVWYRSEKMTTGAPA